MPWPAPIHMIFDSANATRESEYYPAYNTLLSTLFPADDFFFVSPRPISTPPLEPSMVFVVLHRREPVFLLTVKSREALDNDSAREDADDAMRAIIREYRDVRSIPFLHAISALGTRFCEYRFDTASRRISPEAIPRELNTPNVAAPKTWWELDVFSPRGEQRSTAAYFLRLGTGAPLNSRDLQSSARSGTVRHRLARLYDQNSPA